MQNKTVVCGVTWMKLPQFSLSRFGAVSIMKRQIYPVDRISAYEFEFYTEDWPGGSLVDGERRPVRANHYALVRPGQRQQLIPPYRCYFVNFLTSDPELCEFFERLPDTGPMRDPEPILTLIREMMALRDEDTTIGRLKLERCACRLLEIMGEYSAGPERTDQDVVRHRAALVRVDRYIREHPAEDLSLTRLAKLSSMDPSYFHRLFTRMFGLTPAQRVLGCRIAAARVALMNRELGLTEVAQRCGFSSQSYFSTCFKRAVGKSPLAYREEKLNGNQK